MENGKIEIKLKDIKKINDLELEIFEEEDNEYVDRRVIANKERAINNVLNKITKDKDKQLIIYKAITTHTFNSKDYTYKCICDELRNNDFIINYD